MRSEVVDASRFLRLAHENWDLGDTAFIQLRSVLGSGLHLQLRGFDLARRTRPRRIL